MVVLFYILTINVNAFKKKKKRVEESLTTYCYNSVLGILAYD